jgi:hypothetical protein
VVREVCLQGGCVEAFVFVIFCSALLLFQIAFVLFCSALLLFMVSWFCLFCCLCILAFVLLVCVYFACDFNQYFYVWIIAKSNLRNAVLPPNVSFFEATNWSFHG